MNQLKEYWEEFGKGLNYKNLLPPSDEKNEIDVVLHRIKELLMDADAAISEGRSINRVLDRLDAKIKHLPTYKKP